MSRAGRSETSTQDANFQKGNNHLLVIGINQYQDSNIPNLRNARKDAEAVAELLQVHYGFEQCTTLYDGKADCESITDTLEALQNKIKAEDNLLIYFAGHGHYNKTAKIGYLLPADAKWGKPHTYLSNSNLLDYVRAINSRHTFLILDSCFSGALFRTVGETHRAAANLERLPSRWGLAAGLIEEVSDGFYNDNSPFAKSLLTFLNTANDTFLASDLIQHVKNAVPNNATQQPHGGILHKVGDQQGEMVFRRMSSEALDWKKIANSQNISDFMAFLRKHGYQSRYAEEANARIKTLEDRSVWEQVNKHSISALLQFIRANGNNTFVAEAEKTIEQLEGTYSNSPKPKPPVERKESKPTPIKSAEDYFNEAQKKWDEKDYQAVIKLCTKAIEINPNYAEAYSRRARANTNLKDYDYKNVISDINKALGIDPRCAEAYLVWGNAKSDLQDYTGAIADYNKAIELNPQYADAYTNRGVAKYNSQDHTGAITDYTKAIELNPKDAMAYNNLGVAKKNLQDYTSAIADYTKSIELKNPELHLPYHNRGDVKSDLKDYTGAIADYTKAIELNPKYADAYINRGLAKYNLQDYTGAIADYTQSISLNPNDVHIDYNNRGNAKYGLQDYTGAIADYNKAIELNPKFGLAYNNRGLAYQALGKLDLACQDFRRAIELGENTYAPNNFKKYCQGK